MEWNNIFGVPVGAGEGIWFLDQCKQSRVNAEFLKFVNTYV
jgi:hypothetical protein